MPHLSNPTHPSDLKPGRCVTARTFIYDDEPHLWILSYLTAFFVELVLTWLEPWSKHSVSVSELHKGYIFLFCISQNLPSLTLSRSGPTAFLSPQILVAVCFAWGETTSSFRLAFRFRRLRSLWGPKVIGERLCFMPSLQKNSVLDRSSPVWKSSTGGLQ